MTLSDQYHVCDPQMSQILLNFSDYDGSKDSHHVMSFEQRFPVSSHRLKIKLEIPGLKSTVENIVKRGGSKFFIQHRTTTTTEGEKFLRNYEQWYSILVMKDYSKSAVEKQVQMKTRLDADCVGINEIPNTDPLCYTIQQGVGVMDGTTVPSTGTSGIGLSSLRSSTSATAATDGAAAASATQPQTLVNRTLYRPTDFLERLKHYQKEIYIALRANIGTHLDPTAEAARDN